MAENFLEQRLRNRINLVLLNQHNYETGRKILEKNMVKQCKCHGVSGSCEVKTCWKALPAFRVIGNKLKEKYDEAVQVEVKRLGPKKRLALKNYDEEATRIPRAQLVYLNESPSFCKSNFRLASYGTKGRVCNKSSRGIDSCKLLCCGRGHRTEVVTVKYNCSCTFLWCCSVVCKECTKTSHVSTCK